MNKIIKTLDKIVDAIFAYQPPTKKRRESTKNKAKKPLRKDAVHQHAL